MGLAPIHPQCPRRATGPSVVAPARLLARDGSRCGSSESGKGSRVDENVARDRLRTERAEVQDLLRNAEADRDLDRMSENQQETTSDRAQPLTAEGVDDAVAVGLRHRLATLDRALERLDRGTFGRSIRSGVPIPDDRLDADPAAELTVQEAASP